MPPTESTTLDIQATDVTAVAWEDIMREVLADEPDAVAPLFFPERDLQGHLGSSCGSGYTTVNCVGDLCVISGPGGCYDVCAC